MEMLGAHGFCSLNSRPGAFDIGEGYFSAGNDAGLAALRQNGGNSGGQIFFGQSVGVG